MSEQSATVRRAATHDAAELARLAAATFTETFGHLYPPADLASYLASAHTQAAWMKTLADPRVACWLGSAHGALPVGFAVAGYCKLPVEHLEPTAGELRQLYVRATHQGQRLGTRLFEAALQWLERNYAPLYIGVWSDNLGAQRFYGRYGFVKVGEYGFRVGATVDREFILKR